MTMRSFIGSFLHDSEAFVPYVKLTFTCYAMPIGNLRSAI